MSGMHLPWQQDIWARMSGWIRAGRVPQAILFAGPRGIGRGALALRLAAAVLCDVRDADTGEACGQCRACTLREAGTHPDLHRLAPAEDKRDIEVEAVTSLIGRLQLSAGPQGSRVAIIEPADALNRHGINALLKTLEEPPERAHLFLVCERWRALPATLRSRCHLLRLPVPDAEDATRWLEQAVPDLPAPQRSTFRSRPLLALAEGAAQRAADAVAWVDRLRALREGRASPVLAPGEKPDRAAAREALEAMQDWARDALRAQAGQGDGAGGTALLALSDDLVEGLRDLDRNVAPAMVLESIMIRWRDAADASGA